MKDELEFSKEELLKFYYHLLRVRIFDEKCFILRRQGKISTYPGFRGHEAVQVGCALALDKNDWIMPYYRGTALAITFGLDLTTAFLYWKGNPLGEKFNPNLRITNFYITIGSQCPQAVGLALAVKLSGENYFVLTNFVDGGTSEGEFYEALNLASIYNVNAIFVCENNGLAISVPSRRDIPMKKEGIGFQTGIDNLAHKFSNIVESYRIDGTNILEVYKTIKNIKKRNGPAFVEAIVYRLTPHTTDEDHSRYLDIEKVKLWNELFDPVKKFENYLRQLDVLDDKTIEKYKEEINNEIDIAIKMAESIAIPSLKELYNFQND